MDENGKFSMLTEERLIKAPVPKTIIPRTTMPELKAWRVTTATSLYSKTPSTTTHRSKNWSTIQKVKQNPMAYAYSNYKLYNYGSICLYGDTVYSCRKPCLNIAPGNFFYWTALGTLSDTAPATSSGRVIENLAVGTMIYKIADKGSYMQVRTPTNHIGFIAKTDCTETTERQQETIPETTITEQVFRIYEISCDEETNTYTVRAKHISYDFAGNAVYDCKVTESSPMEAIVAIQGSLVLDDDRRIACNITGKKVTQDWSFKNPVSALLDPDSGLVGKLEAKLVRNNQDFFILDSTNKRAGITIAYGVNMLGVNWTRNIENVVTRVVPKSGSADKGYTYISNGGRISGDTVQNQGKDYVESAIADSYGVTRVSILNCNYSEGQEYEKPDGTKAKYTKEEVLTKMLTDAKEKFTKDKVDGVDITLEVEFLLLGDTEEYKQYRDLQWVSLYDIVKIKTGRSGIDAEAQVTEYEYDCLRRRYNSIKLGTVNSFTKRIAGYRFINGSITYEKLSSDLIDRIVTSNATSTTDSGGAGDAPSGGGEKVFVDVIDDLTSTSSTAALSANQGRVLKGITDNLNSNITPQNITGLTHNASIYRTSFYAKRVGNVVYVASQSRSISDASITVGSVIVGGLPIPAAAPIDIPVFNDNGVRTICYMDNNGNLCNRTAITNANDLYYTFSYVCAD